MAGSEAPQSMVAPLSLLAALTEVQFEEVRAAIQTAAHPATYGSSRVRAADALQCETAEAAKVFQFVFALAAVTPNVSDEQQRSRIRELAHAENLPNVTPDQMDVLEARLANLIADDRVILAGKANLLEFEHGQMFSDSSLTSDLRPVFGSAATGDPAGFLIWHTLHIETFGDREDALEVVVDHSDLLQLKRQIERALEKHGSLGKWVEKTGLPLYGSVE